tara:strand:+ start:134 stop:1933 length:1800 start_codon:yes stop_codon:yes gene_type:complete
MQNMTQQQRKKELSKLIEMKPPEWLTSEVYEEYNKKREHLQSTFEPKKSLTSIFTGLESSEWSKNLTWNSRNFQFSPKVLVNMWSKDNIVSDPTSGQDPKTYSKVNLKRASNHAARQWGWTPVFNSEEKSHTKSHSQWIEYGTFNMIKYPNGRTILEPCNVEHRLWGLIAFPLDLITLEYREDLWYYNDELEPVYDSKTNMMVNRMKVNGMYLSDIVANAEKQGCHVTQEEILETHFYANKFNFSILPFYDKEKCEGYFREVNESASKTDAQMFHSYSEPMMSWAKRFSSPKCVNFTPMGASYHPLYEFLSDSDLVKLEGLMITFMIANFIDEGCEAITHTDKNIISHYNKTSGYQNKSKDPKFYSQIKGTLDFLYSLFSKLESPNLSRQLIQHTLLVNKYLKQNNRLIYDEVQFMKKFTKWFSDEQTVKGDLTEFGRWVRGSGAAYGREAERYIKTTFLKELRDDNHLQEIGIVSFSNGLKRIFTEEVIKDSIAEHSNKDIDGSEMYVKPVGGHVISHFELIRMTDEERNQAFKEEGIGDKFDFDKNCRAMSAYHNNRMGVLRLSQYMKIINESDLVVSEARKLAYDRIKSKVITMAA